MVGEDFVCSMTHQQVGIHVRQEVAEMLLLTAGFAPGLLLMWWAARPLLRCSCTLLLQ